MFCVTVLHEAILNMYIAGKRHGERSNKEEEKVVLYYFSCLKRSVLNKVVLFICRELCYAMF